MKHNISITLRKSVKRDSGDLITTQIQTDVCSDGKLKAPEEMFVIKLFCKLIPICSAEGILKAQEGTA